MSDILILLLCAVLLVPPSLTVIRVISDSLDFRQEVQDEIGIAQLRRILLLSYDLCAEETVLTFRYHNEDRTLREVNGRLIIQPGTQIFLCDTENVFFSLEDDVIYVWYQRDGQTYARPLGGLE